MDKNDLSSMPKNCAPYKRTADFTFDTVPDALTNDHSTKEGVWGVLNVVQGEMFYHVPSRQASVELEAGDQMLIESTLLHKVSLKEGSRFFVEFWR